MSRPDTRQGRLWYLWLGLVTAAGLAIRIGTVLGRPHRRPGGDAFTYHYSANLLAAGKGFINPWDYYPYNQHLHMQSAAFPPLFIVVLAAASVVGFKSFFAHRIWCCIIGAGAVALCGLTGREIAGRRVGLIAAVLVAVYPNIWMSDELALSEALSPVVVALLLLAAYRFWRRPGLATAAWLGVSLGVAVLGRDELALLAVLLVLPLALLLRSAPLRRRLTLLAVAGLAAGLTVGPWVGFNLARFEKPVYISTGLGVTLASANCDKTYRGDLAGYWYMPCALAAPIDPRADQSVQEEQARRYATHYIRTHSGELPRVVYDRIGRAFAFYRPTQQLSLDSFFETRPIHWAEVGLGMYYALVLLSVPGIVSLRRRRIPVLPLLAVGLDVLASVVITFGQTRYRSTFEVSLVLLAAVGVDAAWRWLAPAGQPAEAPEPDPEPEPGPPVLAGPVPVG